MKVYKKEEGNEVDIRSGEAEIWRLQGKTKLCVKVLRNNNLSILKKELEIGKTLKKLGISVPKFIEITPVEGSLSGKNNYRKYYGLVMEEINGRTLNDISKDARSIKGLSPVSRARRIQKKAETLWSKEIKKVIKINKELNLFRINDLNDRNVIYDEKKDKVYLIDFTLWWFK